MPQRVIPRLWTPSLKSGFARNAAESLFPNLWKGLVGAWVPALGNTGITKLRDVSRGKTNGAMNSITSADWVTGEKGKALNLDGTNDYVDFGLGTYIDKLEGTTQLGFSIWLKLDTTSVNEGPFIFALGDNLAFLTLRYAVTNIWQIKARSSSADSLQSISSAVAPTGVWHQVAGNVSYPNDYMDIYRNGTISGSGSVTFAQNSLTKGVTNTIIDGLGGTGDITINNFMLDGQIASMVLYDRNLSPPEIHHLYTDHLAPFRLKPLTISLPAAAPATTTAVSVARNWTPSYKSGFARSAAESAHPNLWKGLVGAWVPALGNTGITTLRDVGPSGSHNGTLTNMETTDWVTGEKGYVLDYGGVNEYIDILDTNSDIRSASTGSVCSWFNVPSLTGSSIFTTAQSTNQDVYGGLSIRADGKARVEIRNTTYAFLKDTTTFTYQTNTWYHFCAVQDGTGLKLYINAISQALTDVVTENDSAGWFDNLSTSNNVSIGVLRRPTPITYMVGKIGTVKVYNRALSLNEVQQDYADHLAPFRLKPLTISLPAAAPPAGGRIGSLIGSGGLVGPHGPIINSGGLVG